MWLRHASSASSHTAGWKAARMAEKKGDGGGEEWDSSMSSLSSSARLSGREAMLMSFLCNYLLLRGKLSVGTWVSSCRYPALLCNQCEPCPLSKCHHSEIQGASQWWRERRRPRGRWCLHLLETPHAKREQEGHDASGQLEKLTKGMNKYWGSMRLLLTKMCSLCYI